MPEATRQFIDALNRNLTDADALAGDLPENLRDAAGVYSTAQVNERLLLKAPLESPTFTGTVGGITKAMVGLGDVDNTSDADKPVSDATQTALDLKLTTAEFAALYAAYLASLSASTTGVSMVPGLNGAGDAVVKAPVNGFDIQNYRLTGDSDWSAALQRAYDAAMATTYGGEVIIPPPSVSSDQYEISEQIVCDLDTSKQVTFSGAGKASRIKLHSSLGEVGAFSVTAPSAVYEGLVSFDNFSIVGFGAGSVGLELLNANGFQSTGMRFIGLEDAVRADSSFAVGFDRTRFRDLTAHAFHSTTIAHDMVMNRCSLITVGRTDDVAAIKIDAASDNIIVAYSDMEGGHNIIEMPGGRAFSLIGNYIEYYDGDWFKFSSTMYAATIEGNWLSLSPNQTLANMSGGAFSRNSIYDQAPGAMTVGFDAATFNRMETKANRVFGTATLPSGLDWSYIGSGTETTPLLEARSLNFKTMTPGANILANQYIGGVAFKNLNNVSIAGLGAHFKTNANGSASYLAFMADAVSDAFKVEGSMATAKGGVTDAVGRLQALPRSTTTALASLGDAINTTNKYSGKAVINTTTGAIVTANGATAGATWLALDGTTAHTPV